MFQITSKVFLIFCILISGNILHGQNHSHTFYYPLNIGDYWEYVVHPQQWLKTNKIIGDSLMPDGQVYRVVKQDFLDRTNLIFQRMDEQNNLLLFHQHRNETFLYFKLNVSVGDKWKFEGFSLTDSLYLEVRHIADTTLWGRTFKYAYLHDSADLAPSDYYLGDSIGVFYNGFEGGSSILRSAIINGQKFGEPEDTTRGSYYPLHVGDIWQYEDRSIKEIETHKITGDTTINNQIYYIFHVTWSNPSIPERFYYRTLNDSLWVVEYARDSGDGSWREITVYKLKAGVRESWESLSGPTTLENFGTFTIFSQPQPALFYGVFNGFFTHQEILVKELGFVQRFGTGETSTTTLQGAIIDGKQFGNITHVENSELLPPSTVTLKANYPNPFNIETRISYEIPSSGFVSLKIYNIQGEEVRILLANTVSKGTHSITWDGKNNIGKIVSSGLYIYQVRYKTNNEVMVLAKKLLLIK